jgi:hypothetical protein
VKCKRRQCSGPSSSQVSSSTAVAYGAFSEPPCRADLSHVIAAFSAHSNDAAEGGSCSKVPPRGVPRSPQPCCRYGNYHRCASSGHTPAAAYATELLTSINLRSCTCRYYGYRWADQGELDPRLEALDPEWFEKKRVLDVGCNDGRLTLSMACKYGCKSVVGVDIDVQLVSRACKSLAALHSKNSRQITTASGCAIRHCLGRMSLFFLHCAAQECASVRNGSSMSAGDRSRLLELEFMQENEA